MAKETKNTKGVDPIAAAYFDSLGLPSDLTITLRNVKRAPGEKKDPETIYNLLDICKGYANATNAVTEST